MHGTMYRVASIHSLRISTLRVTSHHAYVIP